MQRFADGADMPFKRVPRNSPWLFNLGHKLIYVMFHNGAFATLEATVRHHLDPEGSFSAWSRNKVQLPPDPAFAATDFVNWEDQREIVRIKAKYDIAPVILLDDEVMGILSLLEALTDEAALNGRLGKPKRGPSGLPID